MSVQRGSVKKRGDSWRARFYVDGAERQRSFRTRGDAQRFLNEELRKVAAGDWVDPAAGAVRFDDYARDWRAAQHARPSTARLHEQRVRLYLSPVLGDVPLRAIRRSHIVEVVRRMTVDLGLSPGVTRFSLAMLRAILQAAVQDRLIASNPAADRTIGVPRAERTRIVPLTAGDVGALAEVIDGRYRAMVLLAAATGLRSGELRALTVDRISPPVHLAALDVAPQRVTLRVDRQITEKRVFGPPKTASSNREVDIGAATAAALIDHVRTYGLGEGGLIFSTTTGAAIGSPTLSKAWTKTVRALQAAGRPLPDGARFHDLRHFHASSLLSAGINPALVAERLGHGNAAITLSVYAKVLPHDRDRVLAASEAIAAAAGELTR